MWRWAWRCGALLLFVSLPMNAVAAPSSALYRVNVTRIAQDAYTVDYSHNVIVTRYCYEYTYGDEAIYDADRSQLIFSAGRNTCSVVGYYRPSANLRRVSQDLYQDTGGQGYLRTKYCYQYAYGEDVLIQSDRVIFIESRDECTISRF